MANISTTLVLGFLDSGKTTYIKSLLKDKDDKNILLIVGEQGEEEYKDIKENVNIVYLEYFEDFNRNDLLELQDKYNPQEIIIEANGMWKYADIALSKPYNWLLNQVVTIIDGSSFDIYLKNVNSLLLEKIKNAHKIIFTHSSQKDKDSLRNKNLRLINKTKEIYFVNEDEVELYDNGTIKLFNRDDEYLVIDDDKFGYFFTDFNDNTLAYIDKKLTVRGFLYKNSKLGLGNFAIGRNAMVCCGQDMVFLSLLCHQEKDIKIENSSYIEVTGIVKMMRMDFNNSNMATLLVEEVKLANSPLDPTVYM